jgi:PAS domain S-box-containing protein
LKKWFRRHRRYSPTPIRSGFAWFFRVSFAGGRSLLFRLDKPFLPLRGWKSMAPTTRRLPSSLRIATALLVFWNSGAEAIFGYRAEGSLGQTLDLIVPERQRARHWEGYRKVMATDITKYGRELLAVPAVTKDGRRISIEFSIALMQAPTGELLGAAAIMQDVTARWQQQKALKVRLMALEGQIR